MTPRLKTSSIAFSLPLVLALALPLTRAAEQAQEVSPSKATPVQKASTVAQTVPAPAPHDGTTVTRSIRDWHPELPSSKTAPAAAKPAAAGRAQQPVGPFPSEPAVEVDLKHAPGFP